MSSNISKWSQTSQTVSKITGNVTKSEPQCLQMFRNVPKCIQIRLPTPNTLKRVVLSTTKKKASGGNHCQAPMSTSSD